MDKYFLGDIEEEFRKLAPNEPMPDDPVKRLVRINEIKSKNKEKENLKKIEKGKREKGEREKEKEKRKKGEDLQTTKDLLNVTRMEISKIEENIELTKKEKQIRKKVQIKRKKLYQKYVDQLERKVLDDLTSKDKIKLTQDEERKILGNRIKPTFSNESKSDTIAYFAYKDKIQDSKNYRSTISSNYNSIINKRKKEELEKNGINVSDSELPEMLELMNKLKHFKNIKPIHNLKDAKLEWANIKLSAKNISRKESLDEAEQALECIENKKELAEIMSKTYEEIDKKFNCDELTSKIKMKIMDNLNVDPKMERITEEEKIERKRERASRNLTENNG